MGKQCGTVCNFVTSQNAGPCSLGGLHLSRAG